MDNTQYMEKLLVSVDRILVDTSALMNPGFQRFVLNNRERFLSHGKRIIILKVVYMEIARNMQSDDNDKSKYALGAVELMGANKEIFQIDSMPLSEEDIAHAFADPELLSELTLHKSEYNQLLITNDQGLSCDAFGINRLESCKGRKVKVCYVTRRGKLEASDCVSKINMNSSNTMVTDNKLRIEKENEATATTYTWKFDWKSFVTGIVSARVMMAIFKVGKSLL